MYTFNLFMAKHFMVSRFNVSLYPVEIVVSDDFV